MPADSPLSNGICEKGVGLVEKLVRRDITKGVVALGWAVSA